ncbi:hypothetical protein F8S09_09800 [Deinococcus sp. SDU3-2]|uniref:Uncharacterized protein n=1 Tax=Deinococcus terrestris TaxID=2651870 RepID=A0A7X1NWJ6_9DEIO|nr:hypothetical protein [Deinococcus terrestris]MPY66978.1 hypothetical protein [Deinococcus terrestris]
MLLSPTDLPTEVLILGSAHLTTLTPDSALRRTLERLEGWKPDAVCVENLPGESVQSYRTEGGEYLKLQWSSFGPALRLEAAARPLRGWSRRDAEALALDPQTPPTARVLAWVLALEPFNALLAWTPDLALPEPLGGLLREYAAHPGEVHRIAVPLARALGHRRLYPFDDFTDTRIEPQLPAIERLWESEPSRASIQNHPMMLEIPQQGQAAREADDYWHYLRYVNSPAVVEQSLDLEVGSYLRHPLPGGEHRSKVADWDARNLFMAA